MENLKKPLTWVLGIVFVGYLFIANCECGEESACPLNNGFNISNAGLNNGFNISNTSLNNGFNISNAGLNGDVLKADAPETVEEDGEPATLEYAANLKEVGFTDSQIEMLLQAEPVESPADMVEDLLQNLLGKEEE